MDTIKCITERRSIRKFTDEKVDTNIIKDIIEVSRFAPSWKNSQISRYTIVENKDIILKIANEGVMGFASNQNTINQAQTLVVVSYEKNRSGFNDDGSYTTSKKGEWQMFDAGIATQTFCLAAWNKGIGTVILGIFDEDKIAEMIGLPKDETVAAIIVLGYAQSIPQPPNRKNIEDIARII